MSAAQGALTPSYLSISTPHSLSSSCTSRVRAQPAERRCKELFHSRACPPAGPRLHALSVERLLQHLRRVPQPLVAGIVAGLVGRELGPYVGRLRRACQVAARRTARPPHHKSRRQRQGAAPAERCLLCVTNALLWTTGCWRIRLRSMASASLILIYQRAGLQRWSCSTPRWLPTHDRKERPAHTDLSEKQHSSNAVWHGVRSEPKSGALSLTHAPAACCCCCCCWAALRLPLDGFHKC